MTDAVHGETLVGVPEEELLQELPLEQSDLLPLNALVERVSNNAYQTLQSLSDTLPSLSNDAKKAKVFATAMDLRKQFIKLLVLVRWSKDAELLNKTRNIIALLVDQQWAHEDVFSGLTQVRKILPNARICDADLVTAIDVICTGTYQRLPASIRDSTVPRVPMSNPQVLDVLRALDQVLTVRLTCSEVVPRDLRLQRIADGKAYFEAPGLYDACLTTSGPNDDDRWWLLDFHFADSATDGDEDLSALLTAPYLDNVFASAEAILAPKDEPEEEPAFVRLHSFLEQQALQRQLHILNYQLQRVARLHWGGNVRFGLDLTSHTMTVQYWVVHSASPSAQERTKSLHKGMLQGRLKLRLHTEPLTGSKKVLSELLSGSKADQGKSAIVVDWDVDEAIRKTTSDLPELALDQLDIEALILAAIDRHSLALMKLFQQEIVAHPGLGAGNAAFCLLRSHSQTGFGPRHSLELFITDTVRVMMYVSTITGRIGIKSLDPNQGTGDELKLSLSETQNSALQRMADQISANTAVLVETLLNFRLQSLAKELELQASWLGLAHLSTIALRPGELDKIGLPNGYPLLYLPLGILPTYYMFIYFIPGQPIAMALVSVMAVVEAGKSMQVISSVKWIDRAQLTSITISGQTLLNAPSKTWLDTSTSRYDLTSEELQLAYNYCIATVAYSHLEEQLRLKLIPFLLVGATTNTAAPPTSNDDPLLPSLCVSAAELMAPFASLAGPNISLQICHWWLPEKRRVEISCKVKLEADIDAEDTVVYKDVTLNCKTGLLQFTSRDLASSISLFQQRWEQVARMCTLINAIAQYRSNTDFSVSLSQINEQRVMMVYGSEKRKLPLNVTVTFHNLGDGLTASRFRLLFGISAGQKGSPQSLNPHQYLATILEHKLNTIADSPVNFWKGFIHVCTWKWSH